MAVSQATIPARIADLRVAIAALEAEIAGKLSERDLGEANEDRRAEAEAEKAKLTETLAALEAMHATEKEMVERIVSFRKATADPGEAIDTDTLRSEMMAEMDRLAATHPDDRMVYAHVLEHSRAGPELQEDGHIDAAKLCRPVAEDHEYPEPDQGFGRLHRGNAIRDPNSEVAQHRAVRRHDHPGHCVAFLDMAAALVPGKTGKWTAKLGSAAITTSQSVAERAYGQGDAATIAQRSFDTAVGLVPTKTALPAYAVGKAQLGSGIVSLVRGSSETDSALRQREALKTSTDMMMDSAISMVELAKAGVQMPVLDKVGTGLSVVKAAASYGFNLRSAQDAYVKDADDLTMRSFDLESNYVCGLKTLGQQLTEALAMFKECEGLV
ncbi:hypothetical protein C8J30_1069 [Rhodobacter viridis]|uniref:Uncharacterized protein n=1 Tax=Rhodobacter viridis TaxID=1054202 RepID=A0A318TYH2_9RHOB|nr:hypothetical protein C8J30_1069 [Rhodobacter viridis]